MHVKRLVASVLLSSSIVGLTVCGTQAAIVNISGAVPAVFPGFGPVSNQNNVINSGTSGVTGVDGSTFKGSGTVTTDLPFYNVDWYFVGAESNNTATLTANGIASFSESNENNNCAVCGVSPVTGPVSLGTSVGQTSSVIDFKVGAPDVVNGANNPPGTPGTPSLIFSYLLRTGPATWSLTNLVTQWFLFAYNDNGGPDDNHDDFIGIAGVYAPGQQGGLDPVPLPGALVLFGSALVGMTFLGRRRARKAAKAAY
jgi:hypothetical protein